MDEHGVGGWTDREGEHAVDMETGVSYRMLVDHVLAPIVFTAPWQLVLGESEVQTHGYEAQ